MYNYQVHLVNSRCLYGTTLKIGPIPVCTYPICLVNSRCLYDTTKNGPIARVYLPDSPSQLALFVQDNP